MIPKKKKNNSGCRFRLHYAGTAKYYTSGGEAQRIKLAGELSKRYWKHILYSDEPLPVYTLKILEY
jgi:excinuclease UvrABC ATPase subunit